MANAKPSAAQPAAIDASLAMPTTRPRIPDRPIVAVINQPPRTLEASAAITCSSSVGITSTARRLAGLLMTVRFSAFAAGSRSMPSHIRRVQISALIAGWCSPIPAVNTNASSPPSVEASRETSPATLKQNSSIASFASGSSLSRSARLSALMPETPVDPTGDRGGPRCR